MPSLPLNLVGEATKIMIPRGYEASVMFLNFDTLPLDQTIQNSTKPGQLSNMST